MLDYQRIVDDVRGALFNNADAGDDFLQAAAADYFLAVDEANQRLSACGALLRKGLRSDAIRLCEIEPSLLDIVETLDFPERESWKELLALRGMAAPAPLLLDVAAELNAAYAVEQPLATLLRRHRLLALGRGALKHRLDVLHKLADADPENPIWVQDVSTFEAERVKELQKDVPQAIFRGDRAAINTLATELESSAWRTKPEPLIRQIAAARSHEARELGLGALQSAANQLHAMHAECDFESGRAVRAQWNQLFAAWGQFADPALLAGVGGALDWLRQQDEQDAQAARHKQAVALLLDGVTARKPADELHRLYGEAQREGEVPQSVERRYREAIEAQELAARQRVRLSLAIVAGFICVAAAVIVTIVWQHVRAAQVDRDVAALQQLVDDGNFAQAQSFIDELATRAPQSAADPRVKEIGSKLAKRQRDERQRREEFAAAMILVDKSIADRLPDGDALERAKKVATGEEEVTRVRKAEHEFAKVASETQSKADQVFLAQVKELRQRVDEIEKQSEGSPDVSIDKLNHAALELSKLLAGSEQISSEAKQPGEALRERIKSLDEENRTAGDRISREEAITAACGDNVAFRRALLDYAEKSPHTERSAGMRAVAGDESPLWDWIAQWNQMVQAMGRKNCAAFNKKSAADLAAGLQKLLDDRPGYPDADAFRHRLPYLDAIVHRTDSEGNAIEAALKPVFTDPLVAGAWMLKDSEGKRYYLLEDPAAKFGELSFLQPAATYGFKYVTGFDLSKKTKSFHGSEIKGGDAAAPQRATGKALAAILEKLGDDNWEPSFCSMIETVLKDNETDPLLRHFLLRKIVEVGCQGSPCLSNGFNSFQESFKNSTVTPAVNWVDPENAAARNERSIAEAELSKLLENLGEAKNNTAKQWRALAASIGREYACVGWLHKDPAGNWRCRTKTNCEASGKLVVVKVDDQNEKAAAFKTVGRIDQGKAAVDAASGSALAEGRPVYVVIPPK